MPALFVVFGAPANLDGQPTGSLIRRVSSAVEASGDHQNCLFFASGGAVKNSTCEALIITQLLSEWGIPRNRIIVDRESMNSIDTVASCKSLLRSRNDISQVVVCTSSYHIPRCSTLMSIAGISHTNVSPPSELRVLGTTKFMKLVVREVLAMPLSLIRAILRLR